MLVVFHHQVADEAKMMDDALPMPQAKKRLVLTTQLMQQVFRPAPAVILSADACSNSESMVYFIARLALGDACSMTTGFQKPFLTTDMCEFIFKFCVLFFLLQKK